MVTRRGFLSAWLVLSVASTSGCATKALWEDHPHWYRESVKSVLLSADGKTLVFIGADYHYIFEAPPALVGTLQAEALHANVKGTLRSFFVDENGKITGDYTLEYTGTDPKLTEQAAALNYQRTSGNVWVCRGTLVGTRYSSHGFKLPEKAAQATALNQNYEIEVGEPSSLLVKAGKTLVTPLTIAADGAIIISGIALLPLGIGFFILLMEAGSGAPGVGIYP